MTETRTLPELQPEDFDVYSGEVREPKRPRLRPIPFRDVLLSNDNRYLIKGLIPREGLVVIWGPPKCGKSFWTFDAIIHVALGWEYRGRRVAQGAVVYVACEGQSGLGVRVEAFRQRHLVEHAQEVPFYLVPDTLNLVEERADLITQIRAVLGEEPPVAVVLDTLNRSIQGSESSDEDMGAYIRAADLLREAFRCAVIIVHHCGIDGTRPRGHTSLTGAVDAQIAIKRSSAGSIIVTVEWMKDGPEGDEIFSRLDPVEVGTDEDGEPITSCVVVPAEEMSTSTSQRKVSDKPKIALDLLRKAIDSDGEAPPPNPHRPDKTLAVKESLWRRYCYSGGLTESDKPDTQLKAFVRAKDSLLAKQHIGIWEEWVWIA